MPRSEPVSRARAATQRGAIHTNVLISVIFVVIGIGVAVFIFMKRRSSAEEDAKAPPPTDMRGSSEPSGGGDEPMRPAARDSKPSGADCDTKALGKKLALVVDEEEKASESDKPGVAQRKKLVLLEISKSCTDKQATEIIQKALTPEKRRALIRRINKTMRSGSEPVMTMRTGTPLDDL